MAQWQPITNLKGLFVHHPPVAMFFLCLLVLSGAFISIGIYSENHDIKNPDITMDWNQMLTSFASLMFCTQLNNTELLNGKQEINSPPLLDHADVEITNTSSKNMGVTNVALLVPLVHIRDIGKQSTISATLLGSQLGLRGAAGKELLNISLFLHLQTQISNADSNSDLVQTLSNNVDTKPGASMSCLRITAPAHVLPQTPSPPECSLHDHLEKIMPPVRAFAIESYKQSSHNAAPCLSLEYTPDPKLTVLLTQEEKALARLHLMLASIMLLALCALMCTTGTLTCTRSCCLLASNLQIQKDTLLGS
ncbi:transmembrane protein 248 isoform X2 [Electrophorus electricus]|uniref:Zgc:158398 n=1 Tax=Electrophorus electricus TaxID=8005 RepID=A0A4W4GR29_ELEEL|nr:transmembrane protein 248 isoform X2 [Electrophorus electricus]